VCYNKVMMDEPSPKSRRKTTARTGLAVELWEIPEAHEIYLLAGWRQWADAGSVSSGLPKYLIQHTHAHPIGTIHSEGFYLFQLPGTHDLLRPVVRFNQGVPEALETPRNELFYSGDEQRGLVILVGDEPHLDIERYAASVLHIARTLKVRRIISLGGVYGELPYQLERPVHAIVSHARQRAEMRRLAVNLSDYHGGASIGSYLCRRAGEQNLEFTGFYAFVPSYDFSTVAGVAGVVRIENDFMAWLSVMRRINHMLGLQIDLSDLEQRSRQLLQAMDEKVAEIDQAAPHLGVREYLQRLTDAFEERPFTPDDDFWEEKLRSLFDKLDDEPE